ncbi:NACHT, LRR and PYD domains-containing protein 3-like isoform X4 [Hypanus sabinus]|uniref:NACHT, LRR and PYD domains-containing protein 3-like isoform X4 n=1 Tax=Hypanus sabinus TaxID=79690 RepID=UPI0028C47B3D|nr:NACHT, LRR and PYD domains-containing protein 3-like isoform X4 [Hypanus sabinus]
MFDPPVIFFFVTEQQKLKTPVHRMDQGSSSGGVPVASTSGKDTGPGSVITKLLASCNDSQLLQLTDIYRVRLEQAMEGGVSGVSLALMAKNQFSVQEHRKISDLADKGERADSSKLLLSLVMEKGSRAQRVMWETFVKMRIGVPELDKILKEIQEYGCDSSHRPISAQLLLKILSELKDLRVITELLASWDDSQLLQLTDFYRDRLEQAMEGGVHGVSLALTAENQFSGEEHRKISDLADKGERADSSKLLLSLVMEKGSRARRVMWETFVKMRIGVPKLDKILKEIQIYGCDPSHRPISAQLLLKFLSELKDVQQKHKETLRAKTETLRVNTILMREKVKVFQLVDRYAELTVISTVRDRRLVEHELLARGRDHEEWREKHLCGELEKLQMDQLFQSRFSQTNSKSGSSAAVAGVPGIGKTTMVQKIVYDWATGKIYQQFQFVFSFKFRDLNSINCRINLKELILDQYPYFGNILREVWKNPEGSLFIFDGLDEFNDQINFSDRRRDTETRSTCTDPDFKCKVSDIVYSLIQGKLLPGCSVLVTTRPTALHLLEKAEIGTEAEILGFSGEERKEYFIRHFEDQTVAEAVFKHVKENEILYTMSYNPSYCWILALALGPFFTQRVRDPQRVPKTITHLYSYYIYNILKNHGREIENPRDVLLRVGQMAFRGVSERKIVFTDGDLINYKLQPSQFLSGFLMELLEREDSARSVVYTFPHLTIQEFVAAVAQFLIPDGRDITKLLTEAHCVKDGRFEVFLRFVAGLSNPMAARGLEEFLGPFPHETTCRVIDWVKEEVKRQSGNTGSEAGKRSLLNTLHYLFESQNRGLAQAALGSVETLSFSGMTLTPIDCAVLSHVIGLCDTIKHLDLENCHIQYEGIQRLGPGLHKCQELRLGRNDLGDSGVKLVSAALRNPECKIQRLRLWGNRFSETGGKELRSLQEPRPGLMVDL